MVPMESDLRHQISKSRRLLSANAHQWTKIRASSKGTLPVLAALLQVVLKHADVKLVQDLAQALLYRGLVV